MTTQVIALLFLAAVLGGVPSTEATSLLTSWTEVLSEVATMTATAASTSVLVTASNATDEELKTTVLFYLYTPTNPESPQQIYLNDSDTLSSSNFNTSLPTRIVIHGWQNNCNSSVGTELREAYLAEGDYNVIIVDWSSYAEEDYITARKKIVCVGAFIGSMIDFLVEQGMDIDTLMVMGHSLGAHISGVACRSASNTVPIFIAMDPAGPLFYGFTTTATMTSTDADYVQVIHTNAGELGYDGTLGDADFWPNGGSMQAGCVLDVVGSCSHGRSYLYLAESISSSSSKFTADICSNYVMYLLGTCSSNNSTYMGGATVDTSASGTYYLSTNTASLYAKG